MPYAKHYMFLFGGHLLALRERFLFFCCVQDMEIYILHHDTFNLLG